jgi:CheY-like chemotaxis protein
MISKELTEAMGGTIEVESAPAVGTCFWVRIPLHVASDLPQRETVVASIEPRTDFAALIGGRVLLVDDNRVNQQLGSAMLERMGLSFDLADNGAHALQRIAQHDYALVLMDMEMPEMDGLSATLQVRRNEAASQSSGLHLPIVAMTANALAEDRERCFAAGMDGYISKPISLAALHSEILRLFGTAEMLAAVAPVSSAQPVSGPVFNRAMVIDMLGDEDLFNELASIFIADVPGYIAELDQALETADWPRLARAAHTLKGLFATFAASAAERDGRVLEQAANTADTEVCTRTVPLIRAHTLALAEAMKA